VRAGGVPVFSPGEEGVFNQISGSPAQPGSPYEVALPITSTTPTLMKHTINFNFGDGNTNASAGLQNSQSSTQTKITIAAGTGVSQTDTNASETASSLEVIYNVEWTAPAGGFGAPIAGNFSLPIGAKVGFDGTASVSATIEWDYIAGESEFALGPTFTASKSFNNIGGDVSPLVVLTSITAPTEYFTPSSIPAGDIIALSADITFTADADDPTLIEVPTAYDFSDAGVTTDQVGTDSLDVVPEPSSMMLIIVAAGTFLLMRRRTPLCS
jgi:hypothetical protein